MSRGSLTAAFFVPLPVGSALVDLPACKPLAPGFPSDIEPYYKGKTVYHEE